MFDITKIAARETDTLHLKGPDDELLFDDGGAPVTVTVYGPGSKAFVSADTAATNRFLEKQAAGKKAKAATLTADELNDQRIEKLVACTIRFDNFGYPPAGDAQGQVLHRAIYADPSIGFVAQQVLEHIGDWGNFTKGSATT